MAFPVLRSLGPRRLRWRLVAGFALTVLLLQASLTLAERILVQKTLIDSIQQNLQDTVRAGLAGPDFGQTLAKEEKGLGTAAGTSSPDCRPSVVPDTAASRAASRPSGPASRRRG